MLLAFFIYLASVFDTLNSMSKTALLILFFVFLGSFIIKIVSLYESDLTLHKITSKSIKICAISSIIFGAIVVLVPKSSTMYLMAGAYIGTEAVKNPDVVNKLSKVNKIIDYKLDEILNVLESKNSDSKTK